MIGLPANVTQYLDRHGKVRLRFRKAGLPSRHLRAAPGTPEFQDELNAARQGQRDSLADLRRERKSRRLRRMRTPLPRGAFVYVIGTARGPVKIGYTSDLRRRLSKLQIGHPEQLLVLAHAPGSEEDERALHAAFGQSRLRGEWFRRTPEVCDLMDDLATCLIGLAKLRGRKDDI